MSWAFFARAAASVSAACRTQQGPRVQAPTSAYRRMLRDAYLMAGSGAEESILHLAHLDLLILLFQDDVVLLGRLLRRAGVAGDDNVHVRLTSQQIRVGGEIVDNDVVGARPGLAGLVAFGAVALGLVLGQLAAVFG